jgi:hypothetical protein
VTEGFFVTAEFGRVELLPRAYASFLGRDVRAFPVSDLSFG